MPLRSVTGNFLRKIHFHFHPFDHTRVKIRDSLPKSIPFSSKTKYSYHYSSEARSWRKPHKDQFLWILLSGHAAIIFGINANVVLADGVPIEVNSQNSAKYGGITGLQKIEDGSIVSNIHTSKWRVFTDNGRDLFIQGKLEEAEKFFLSALEEAKEGFGEKDPHVASACNNLAELYRVKKAFDKAEPLYLDAVNVLEDSLGPEDVRVGIALHNLGKFYLVQGKLEEARASYERALKIKGRVLGLGHPDYADTIFHLGVVLYFQGREKDADAFIQDSVRILEENGHGESIIVVKRLRFLSQIYLKSNQTIKAENIQRKILHILELSKGWRSLDTIIAAEGLALTLQSGASLKEAEELLEKCLDSRKSLLPEDHLQISANLLHLARVAMLNSIPLGKTDLSKAIAKLDQAKDRLGHATRIALRVLYNSVKAEDKMKKTKASAKARNDARSAMIILLQTFVVFGNIEKRRQELQLSEGDLLILEVENLLHKCVSTYKEFEALSSVSDSNEVKSAYVSCLKTLLTLLSDGNNYGIRDEIKRVEAEIASDRKPVNEAGG